LIKVHCTRTDLL